ncbi:hypothetical protein JCM19046_4686 [Bacillus sp. JCM 19046]|nr:hypothetical protein JCM19046_4686 [Bacillus sp. JCM 19046]
MTGTVMNRAEGSVEIVAQGEAEELTAFLADVKKGNSFSTVSTLTKKKWNMSRMKLGLQLSIKLK